MKIDNAEDLNVVMPMYNLIEYSKNYRKTTGSLWNYYRDEQGNTYNAGADESDYDANKAAKNETEIVIPLKHLINFWRSLNIPIINCEVELIEVI